MQWGLVAKSLSGLFIHPLWAFQILFYSVSFVSRFTFEDVGLPEDSRSLSQSTGWRLPADIQKTRNEKLYTRQLGSPVKTLGKAELNPVKPSKLISQRLKVFDVRTVQRRGLSLLCKKRRLKSFSGDSFDGISRLKHFTVTLSDWGKTPTNAKKTFFSPIFSVKIHFSLLHFA